MSKINIVPDLSLGSLELKRFQSFAIDEQKIFLSKLCKNFGFIKNIENNGGIVAQPFNVSLPYQTISLSELFAIDSDFNFIKTDKTYSLQIYPGTFWLRVSYIQKVIEKGLITVASNGEITGFDTEFLNILKAYSDLPTKIVFTNSVYNTQEYSVLHVIDNNNAVLQGNFTNETNLEFAIVGEFTPGINIINENKYPFRFDSCLIEVIQETDFNTRPQYEENKYFYIARIVNPGNSNLIIQDKKNEYFSLIDDKVNFYKSQFAKIISSRLNTSKLQLDENIVTLEHGLLCSNFTISQNSKQITLSGVLGNKYKRYQIDLNSLINYRLYLENGKYYNVVDYSISGFDINLALNNIDIDDFSDNAGGILFEQELFLCPPYDYIEYEFLQDNDTIGNKNLKRTFVFPINSKSCDCSLNLDYDKVYFRLKYRFINNLQVSEWFLHDSDLLNGYLTEESFDNTGNLRPFENQIRKKFESSLINGFIECNLSKNSFYFDKKKIEKNNEGFANIFFTQQQQVLQLYPGTSKKTQIFNTANSFSSNFSNIFINLNNSENTQDGSQFEIIIKNASVPNDKTISIVYGFVSELSPGNVLKVINIRDILHSKNVDGGIKISCLFSGGKWIATQNYELPRKGEVLEFHGTDIEFSECFSKSGLGQSYGWYGCAICDGNNGTFDMREKFAMGYSSEKNTIGQIGGSNTLELLIQNIPSHSHFFRSEYKSVAKNTGTGESALGNNVDWEKPISDSSEALKGVTSKIGGNTDKKTEPIDNRPRFIVLVYVKRTY
jgi:hypothetical protein